MYIMQIYASNFIQVPNSIFLFVDKTALNFNSSYGYRYTPPPKKIIPRKNMKKNRGAKVSTLCVVNRLQIFQYYSIVGSLNLENRYEFLNSFFTQYPTQPGLI